MFRSLTIIGELVLNLANVIFTLKHWVKLRRHLSCGCVAACQGMACVLYAEQNVIDSVAFCTATTHMPFHDMLPHNRTINKDVLSLNVLM